MAFEVLNHLAKKSNSVVIAPTVAMAILLLAYLFFGVVLFHTLAELFSVFVGVMMLVIVWNTKQFTKNNFLVYLGLGYFWVAVLDTLHLLAIEGLPLHFMSNEQSMMHFSVYTRLFEGFLLLGAPFFVTRKLNAVFVFNSFAALSIFISWLSVYFLQPVLIAEGKFTAVYIGFEIVVVYIFLLALGVFLYKRKDFSRTTLVLIISALILTILSEIAFTIDKQYSMIPFVFGHLFKYLSFWLIYTLIVEITLREPFHALALDSSSYDAMPYSAVIVDSEGYISQANRATLIQFELPWNKLRNQHVHGIFHNNEISPKNCNVCQAIQRATSLHNTAIHQPDRQKYFLLSLTTLEIGKTNYGMIQSMVDVTLQKEAEHKLIQNELRYRVLIESLPIGVFETNVVGECTYVNKKWQELAGIPFEQALGEGWKNALHEDDKLRVFNAWQNHIHENAPWDTEYRFRNIDQQIKYILGRAVALKDEHNTITGFIGTTIDLTEKKSTAERLEALFQAMEQAPVSVVITDLDGKIEYVNTCFETTSGYSYKEVKGENPRLLGSGKTPNKIYKVLWRHLLAGKNFVCELQNRTKDGNIFWEKAKFSVIKDKTGCAYNYLAIKEDITQLKVQEELLLYQAHFDALTNLPNRFLSLDRLSQLLEEAEREHENVAVLFLDLDDFKKVNDSLSHEIGDELLIEVAERLSGVVRAVDTVGRLGGDEFIVMLRNIKEVSQTQIMAEQLLDVLRATFSLQGRSFMLSASIGIAVYPQDGITASELLRNADTAMYHAKDMGRNTLSFYTDAMNKEVARQLAIEEQIHGALQRQEFSVFYQPQLDVKKRSIIGAEALIRWQNPVLGNISPMEFIPIAERSGLIIAIGYFVFEEALRMTAQWQKKYDPNFRIAVNLSPRQFRDPDLVDKIRSIIATAGLDVRIIELEITEGVLMSGHQYIDEALAQLNKLGVSIAMDDFGTGYSSLSYLKSYPFDVLKIDQSFVRDITLDSSDRELINAAIAMAHGLNLSVVAEGVETEEQFAYLKKLNCDFAQGYLFSKPVPAEAMTQILSS